MLSLQLGKRDVVVKIFRHLEEAEQAVRREVAVLQRLTNTELVPQLRAYNLNCHFLAMDYIDGEALVYEIDANNAIEVARRLGRWFASFSELMKRKRLPDSWLGYLDRYETVLTADERRRYQAFLASLPIEEHAIAKNDAYLGNFVTTKDNRLVGIDFDAAVFKPVGWDILLTARVLAQKFPSRIEEVVRALVEGWGGGTDTISAEDFERLAMCFAFCTAFTDPTGTRKVPRPL